MWFRVGKTARWNERSPGKEDDVKEAALDLTPRDNEEVSVFQVHSEEEGLRVAAVFALTQRDEPDYIDMVLLPESITDGDEIVPHPTRDDGLPAYLSDRHYELPGLDNEAVRQSLAARALETQQVKAKRIRKAEIKELAKSGLLELDGVRDAVKPGWKDYLDKE
jgi:hypothetical protein